MSYVSSVYGFFLQHQILAWILCWGIILPLLRKRTPAEWVSLAERKPRTQGLIRAARGVGVDPAKFLSGMIQFLTGRVRAAGLTDEFTPAQAAELARANISDSSKSKPRIPPLVVLLVMASLASCAGTQTPATVAHEARVISYEVALGYCTVHRVATPLILMAEGMYPAMTIPAHVADAFCATVLLQPDPHYTDSPGLHPVYQREYAISPSGFMVVTQ